MLACGGFGFCWRADNGDNGKEKWGKKDFYQLLPPFKDCGARSASTLLNSRCLWRETICSWVHVHTFSSFWLKSFRLRISGQHVMWSIPLWRLHAATHLLGTDAQHDEFHALWACFIPMEVFIWCIFILFRLLNWLESECWAPCKPG